jgi:hypothetical protein
VRNRRLLRNHGHDGDLSISGGWEVSRRYVRPEPGMHMDTLLRRVSYLHLLSRLTQRAGYNPEE